MNRNIWHYGFLFLFIEVEEKRKSSIDEAERKSSVDKPRRKKLILDRTKPLGPKVLPRKKSIEKKNALPSKKALEKKLSPKLSPVGEELKNVEPVKPVNLTDLKKWQQIFADPDSDLESSSISMSKSPMPLSPMKGQIVQVTRSRANTPLEVQYVIEVLRINVLYNFWHSILYKRWTDCWFK